MKGSAELGQLWAQAGPAEQNQNSFLQNQVQQSAVCFFLQVLVPFAEDGSVEVEQNSDLPEDESLCPEPDKAVSRVGSGQNGTAWLGAAANFLYCSFYW